MLDMETSLTGRAGTRAGLASGQTNRPDRRGADPDTGPARTQSVQ